MTYGQLSVGSEFKKNMYLNDTASFTSNAYPKSQVPSGIGRLSQLENLNLSYSSFSGHVPKEISYLTQLVSLDLTGNKLKLQSPGFRNLVQSSKVNISSEIPDVLANCSSLTSLVLRDCGLTGYFPIGIFDLSTLQLLDVQDNYELSGYFTEFHGNSQLKDLIIGGTKFQGEFPASIGNLMHLNQLNLYGCSFNGPLPVSVSNLTQLIITLIQAIVTCLLHDLYLDNNKIEGLVPAWMWNISKETLSELSLTENLLTGFEQQSPVAPWARLHILDLSHNMLRGLIPMPPPATQNFFSQVPSGIGRLSQLENLNLSYSSFSGHVPKEISYLTQLVSLDLTGNKLKLQSPGFRNLVQSSKVNISSEIPDVLANCSSLTSLVLRDCGLTGYFPIGLCDLSTLQHLDVQDNYELSGYFTEFHGNSQLKDLIIGGTKFQGELPASVGCLIHLNQLNLYVCSFNGPLPVSVSNLTQLTVLDLGYNNFDTSNCDLLGKFPNLSYLDLSGNNLSCEIPSSIGDLTQLREIYLIDTNMKLKALNLGGNRITLSATNNHSNTSPPKFQILRLQSCNLRAFLHFLRFQHPLHDLYLDNNKIEGLVPAWMWNISKETLSELSLTENLLTGFEQQSPVAPWARLHILDLSHNMLRGLIRMPPPATQNFFVSNNKLTGEIPPSICDLQSLELLDLSYNNITGSFLHALGT
ncbi:leucine-rich repeat protein [Artemisia annua]|uniref:Leucine-rich repeat protein n=1 Tax=Artemisia annua TaxID=35608 RepID=A0A2U1PUP2_ARTAN|nr:leucine-rich repeat protein [Artemisia annua]